MPPISILGAFSWLLRGLPYYDYDFDDDSTALCFLHFSNLSEASECGWMSDQATSQAWDGLCFLVSSYSPIVISHPFPNYSQNQRQKTTLTTPKDHHTIHEAKRTEHTSLAQQRERRWYGPSFPFFPLWLFLPHALFAFLFSLPFLRSCGYRGRESL